MFFNSQEKIFSLFKTVNQVPHGDISSLFAEFYCYLLIAGLYREGEGRGGVHIDPVRISDQYFFMPSGSYQPSIAIALTKGLKTRFTALERHPDLNDRERNVLASLDYIFMPKCDGYVTLSARELFTIGLTRCFDQNMLAVARYVSVAFGQRDFLSAVKLPRLYLSCFGNIHLARDSDCPDDHEACVTLNAPLLTYGAVAPSGDTVTALFSIVSAQLEWMAGTYWPGQTLGDTLSQLTFLTKYNQFETEVPIPCLANALYMRCLMGIKEHNPTEPAINFYRDFLYGSADSREVSRAGLLKIMLNVMMEHLGESSLDHVIPTHSFYNQLFNTSSLRGSVYKRPSRLRFALEALEDGSSDDTSDSTDPEVEEAAPGDEGNDEVSDPVTDTDVDPIESDPATVTPGGEDPTLASLDDNVTQNTIGLISFDKTGEGVDEDLYRSAVVALNDRFRSDKTINISAKTKDALNHWVNGWLYRTAIDATKNQINILKLQSYLKIF